jgi:hypothetical protein
MAQDVYVANETFACELDGENLIVHRGITRVRAGHPLYENYKGNFDLVDRDLQYDVEEATAPPARSGQSEAVKQTQKGRQANQVSAEAVEVGLAHSDGRNDPAPSKKK